jgi:hypothetical protein
MRVASVPSWLVKILIVRWDIISASCSATACVGAWNPTTLCYVEE